MAMNDTTSVLNALDEHLHPESIQKMSAQLGMDTATTSKAVSMAIPILLGGLARNVSNADGAASLDKALTAHGGGIAGAAGAAILGHILGSRRASVEDGLGRATGLDAQKIAPLLAMLAPLVMNVLGRMKRDQSMDAEKLPEVLGQANLDMARQSPAVGDLSRVLDGDDASKISDDIARIGSTVLGGLLGEPV